MAKQLNHRREALGDVRMVSVAEVAKAAYLSKMTVYRMIHSGELPAVRIGRSYRVREADALALLQGGAR